MHSIMIVDDEFMSQDILNNYIGTELPDYHVIHVCNNGCEALKAFQETPADIVLVDICMPVMDGLTLIEALNNLSNDYVPIIISSYGEFEYAKTAMKLGVVHYLLKPLDFDELNYCLEAAAHTLQSRRLAHSNLTLHDDEQELYLIDIMTGKYQEQAAARQDFSRLAFPFAYDNCNGICIQISFSQTKWTYGKDSLFTALGNLLHLLYAPIFLLPLFRKSTSSDFLLIYNLQESLNFDALIEQSEQLLNTTISIRQLTHFASIEQLRVLPPVHRQPKYEISSAFSENSSVNIQSTIQQAISYMKEHYAEDLTREDVADKVYMSGAYFSRCFKMVTQTTYKDYLTEIRMLKAIELLKTNIKVQDIAQQVGYSDPYRFSVSFRHYTSYTPSEYRSKVLKLI